MDGRKKVSMLSGYFSYQCATQRIIKKRLITPLWWHPRHTWHVATFPRTENSRKKDDKKVTKRNFRRAKLEKAVYPRHNHTDVSFDTPGVGWSENSNDKTFLRATPMTKPLIHLGARWYWHHLSATAKGNHGIQNSPQANNSCFMTV